jgi:hypothetical protein
MATRSVSRFPSRSNRHNSTLVALAEKRAKFVPRPSQVAPRGFGEPAEILPLLDLRNEKDCSKGWDNNAKLRAVTVTTVNTAPAFPTLLPSLIAASELNTSRHAPRGANRRSFRLMWA